MNIKTVIISRSDNIGDVILTLPVAGAIKKSDKNIRVLFMAQAYMKPLIDLSENIDGFIDYTELSSLNKKDAINKLKSFHADAIIHVLPNKKIARLSKKAKIKYRIGTSRRYYNALYCNKLSNLKRKNSNLHESQLNLKLLEKINIKDSYEIPEIPALYGLETKLQLKDELALLFDRSKKNIILHPKSKGSAREWGLDNFSKLIALLPADQYKIFLTGTAQEGSLMSTFLEKHKNDVTDLTGKLSFQELIAFISNASVLVAASTGPLHIAAATGIKTIGIFAPMRPIHPGRWKPIGKKANYLVLDKICNKCKKNTFCECIHSINPESVASLIV